VVDTAQLQPVLVIPFANHRAKIGIAGIAALASVVRMKYPSPVGRMCCADAPRSISETMSWGVYPVSIIAGRM
jgi:hypothetical protein